MATDACPTGSHLPSKYEWTVLADNLGGEAVAGGKMKKTGTFYWNHPNTGATNESGFTALGLGKFVDGDLNWWKNLAFYWSSTEENNTGSAWRATLFYNSTELQLDTDPKNHEMSVRCVKD